ncbi:MAG TPA: DUF6279 family lipoprotein [Burkholderiales bacterium]|nr:DUF6279 family lipoprotein [Burkholderiales bacterium]
MTSLNPRCRNVLRAFAVALAAAVLLAGCSALQFSYNNAATIARFMAGDYVDFNAAQAQEFKARFGRFHDWHRRQELPLYASLMRTAAERAEDGISGDDARWAIAAVRANYRTVMAQAATAAAPILAALSPRQIAQLEKAVAEKNAKYEKEHLLGDAKDLRDKRIEQVEDQFGEWVGRLSKAQKQRIERFVADYGDMAALRFADRQRWQHEALAVIRSERDPALLAAILQDLFAHPEKKRPQVLQQALDRYDQAVMELVMDIDRTLTPEQRARAVKRMRKYADDFTQLAHPAEAHGADQPS